jgi:hypothetical protein
MKLFAKMALIACVHAGVLFIAYGRKWLEYLSPMMGGWTTVIWLLLPSCTAFFLYYFSLSDAGLFSARHRRGKLATCCIVATLFSLYWGVFFSLNTYGE